MIRRIHVLSMVLCWSVPLCAFAQDSRPSLAHPPVAVTPPARQQGGPPAQPEQPQQAARPPAGPPQGDTRARIRARTDLVPVPVTVKDGSGQLVGDLQRNEFRVFQDDVEQPIVFFTSDPFPLSAVVLIDNSLAEKEAQQVQKSLTSISAGFAASDEVAVVRYDEYPEVVSDFSANNDELFTLLKRFQLGSHDDTIYSSATNSGPAINGHPLPNGMGPPQHGSGRPQNDIALDDAVYAAGQMLKGRGRDRRKIIFLLSDGTNSRHNQHTFDETLRSLLTADVNVFSVSVSHALPLGPLTRSPLQRDSGTPQKYAADTGGDTFYAAKQRDLERLYSEVTEEARNQYTLAFSPNGAEQGRDFHKIEVRVSRPGLNVIAKQGYYLSAIRAAQ